MLDLVVLGNLLVDDIVHSDGSTRMAQPGGAVLYVALAARLFGLKVGIASWRGDDYPPATLEALAQRGIDLTGVRPLGQPGLRTWLLDEGQVRQVVHRLAGPTHAMVSPTAEQLPEAWRNQARAFHLAPMPFAMQADLVNALAARSDALISLDPYELLRDENDLQAWHPVLSKIDVFLLSKDEMLLPEAAQEALPRLSVGRLQQVIFKRGASGGLALDHGQLLSWSALAPEVIDTEVVDTTGAGDAFAAGFLAGRLLGDNMRRCLERGTIAASFAIEALGADGLLAATPEAAAERLAKTYPREPQPLG